MKFRDDFAANFLSQEKFMEFLDQVELPYQYDYGFFRRGESGIMRYDSSTGKQRENPERHVC